MEKRRIGEDFKYVWGINWNGVSEDFSDTLEMVLTASVYGKRKELKRDVDYVVDGNLLKIDFTPKICTISGIYNLELNYVKPSDGFIDGDRRSAVDIDAFQIVPKSAQITATGGITGTSDVITGSYGLSAYEVAMANGFVGTQAEWLESLRGASGNKIIGVSIEGDDLVYHLDEGEDITLSNGRILLRGEEGVAVSSAAFVDNDLVFTLSDNSSVIIANAKPTLKGDALSFEELTEAQKSELRGAGITAIEQTASSGSEKTYTITYGDSQTTTFTVNDGNDGHTPVISFVGTTIYVDGVAQVDLKGNKGDTGIGVPIGGATGQQLTKKSATDYDFEWQTPAGSGDMLKSVYDSDGNGVVDNAEKVNGFTVETNVPANAKFTDTVYTHPETHPASIISQDASNRFVSDAEKLAWNDKVDNSRVLTDVPANAKFTDTVYSHPASHPYSMITGAPDSLPANGGDSATVNGKTVEENVPSGAKFTDTTYEEITEAEINTGTASTLRTITARRVTFILSKISTLISNAISALTKNDVGLGNLDNIQQATKEEFNTHDADGTRHITAGERSAWGAKWDYNESTIKDVKVNNATNADTVNGKTVAENVPAGAKFTDTVYTHPAGTNPHGTTKADVGLGNVDNTSDANKPVSTAQQTALNAKIDASKFQVVASLPASPVTGVFYFVKE